MFAEDANRTLWTSGGGPVVGWLNTKMCDETHDEEKSQGWTALVLDTNGNGKRDAYVEPNQPADPAKDKRIRRRPLLGRAGARRIDLGHRPRVPRRGRAADAGARTRRRPRSPNSTSRSDPTPGFSPRGGDVDRNGVVLDRARQRPHRELRSPQVQRPAERTEGDRPALPRGLDALRRSRCRSSKASPSPAAPRRAITPGSTSTTRSASATTRRSTPATLPKACSR